MRKLMTIIALVVLGAVSAQAVDILYYENYSTNGNSKIDLFDAGLHYLWNGGPEYGAVAQAATNTAEIGRPFLQWTKAGTGSDWANCVALTNNPGENYEMPQDGVSECLQRLCYASGEEWAQVVTAINTGLPLHPSSNYTIKVVSKVWDVFDSSPLASDGNPGTGSIRLSAGYWNPNAVSNNFEWMEAGQQFTNLLSTAWVTNSIDWVGARVSTNLHGENLTVVLGHGVSWDEMLPILPAYPDIRESPPGINNTEEPPPGSGSATNMFVTVVDEWWVEATNPYADWADDEGVTGGMTDDDDSDGVDNFTEWAFGGDPGDSAGTVLVGSSFYDDSGVTNYFKYITPRLTQTVSQPKWWQSGVDYELWVASDLVAGDWVYYDYIGWEKGANEAGFNADYDGVTNVYWNTEDNDVQFLQQRVSHPSYNP